ncbi:MAG: hypothetical protein IPG92_15085 [Flavobacteriales bacterium]|nr:hypothetical protein [Flavobacteriales bacterium]
MRQFSLWLVALALFAACQPATPTKEAAPREIHTTDYDLIIPAEQKALLILFPCFSCDAADTRAESRIADTAAANGIAVLMMNFNRHIMMSEAEKEEVIGTIAGAVKEHDVDASNTFIGGFSSGGNVSVLLAKALLRSADPPVKLKGVFAVDSPLDLVLLYECSQRDLAKTTFPEYKDEARYGGGAPGQHTGTTHGQPGQLRTLRSPAQHGRERGAAEGPAHPLLHGAGHGVVARQPRRWL